MLFLSMKTYVHFVYPSVILVSFSPLPIADQVKEESNQSIWVPTKCQALSHAYSHVVS